MVRTSMNARERRTDNTKMSMNIYSDRCPDDLKFSNGKTFTGNRTSL